MKIPALFAPMMLSFCIGVSAQGPNWQGLDLKRDGVFGISLEQAYAHLAGSRQAKNVIVAVIDSGLDTLHPALRDVLWSNPREIPGNGIDDDHNGYIDDVHGWNFTGLSISRDSVARLMSTKSAFFDSLSFAGVPAALRVEYQNYRQINRALDGLREKMQSTLSQLNETAGILDGMVLRIGHEHPQTKDFIKLRNDDSSFKNLLDAVIAQLPLYGDYDAFRKGIASEQGSLVYAIAHMVTGKDSLNIAAGFMENNANISYDKVFTLPAKTELFTRQPLIFHGTHLAGIIGGSLDRSTGIKGVAGHVQLMPLKVYSALFPAPMDESIAHAIRYATDNGARIINLSLGTSVSPGKNAVDAAVKYAMKKGVLIVHAVGNEGLDLDNVGANGFFPNKYYADGSGEAAAWINVGASGWKDDSTLAAGFSNYGKLTVDVFAPGEQIYSTVPGAAYAKFNGTSMAAPVVAGLAALIMEFYPDLSAAQVKEIIVRSVTRVNHAVIVPGHSAVTVLRPFSSLCLSGGIVNACEALVLASKY